MFAEFHSGQLQLSRLNFGTIILLPKCKEVVQIQQFRSICLLNVSFKKSKVLINRLTLVAEKVISVFAREEYHGGDCCFT
jgi:hypothetical protein